MKQTLTLLLISASAFILISCILQSDPAAIKGLVILFGLPYENANHPEAVPVAGKKFYVREFNLSRNHNGPMIDSIVSNSAGAFSVALQPGHNSFISVESAKEIGFDKHFKSSECDSLCFKKQLKAGEATLQVDSKDNVDLRILVSGMDSY